MVGSRLGKRHRGDDITEEFFGENVKTGSYLKISLTGDKPLRSKGWPWVQAGLRQVFEREKLEKATFLRDGSLLVKTKNEVQTAKLLSMNKMLGEPCEVIRDQTLNTSKGTIHSYDLLDLADDDIVQWLKEFGVVGAKRFTKRVGNKVEPTPTVLLTFDMPSCPEKIQLDYATYHIKRHIPNPLICYNCGQFGHPESRCKNKKRCLECGEHTHVPEGACQRKCMSCGSSDHSCRSRDCTRWQKEKEICRLKVDLEISYAEARRHYETSHKPPTLQPYSAIVRTPSDSQRPKQDEQDLKDKVEQLEKKIDELTKLLTMRTELPSSSSDLNTELHSQTDSSKTPKKVGTKQLQPQAKGKKDRISDTGPNKASLPKPVQEKTTTVRKPARGHTSRSHASQGKDIHMTSEDISEVDESEMISQVIVRRGRSVSADNRDHRPAFNRRSWTDDL